MSEIVAAIITGVAAFIAGILVNMQGKSQLFSSTISSERMIWIKEMRELCAELITICEMYSKDELPPKILKRFLFVRNSMLLHLDPPGWYSTDDELWDLLQEADFEKIKGEIRRIRKLMAGIFKTEWDKVKIEAGSSPWRVHKIKKLQEKMRKEKTRNCDGK